MAARLAPVADLGRAALFVAFGLMSVRVYPGEAALTRIPSLRTSAARTTVSMFSAAFEIRYAGDSASAVSPSEAMLLVRFTIRP